MQPVQIIDYENERINDCSWCNSSDGVCVMKMQDNTVNVLCGGCLGVPITPIKPYKIICSKCNVSTEQVFLKNNTFGCNKCLSKPFLWEVMNECLFDISKKTREIFSMYHNEADSDKQIISLLNKKLVVVGFNRTIRCIKHMRMLYCMYYKENTNKQNVENPVFKCNCGRFETKICNYKKEQHCVVCIEFYKTVSMYLALLIRDHKVFDTIDQIANNAITETHALLSWLHFHKSHSQYFVNQRLRCILQYFFFSLDLNRRRFRQPLDPEAITLSLVFCKQVCDWCQHNDVVMQGKVDQIPFNVCLHCHAAAIYECNNEFYLKCQNCKRCASKYYNVDLNMYLCSVCEFSTQYNTDCEDIDDLLTFQVSDSLPQTNQPSTNCLLCHAQSKLLQQHYDHAYLKNKQFSLCQSCYINHTTQYKQKTYITCYNCYDPLVQHSKITKENHIVCIECFEKTTDLTCK